jgi:hypothetical protein
MNEIARFLHNGHFYEDAKKAFDLADDVLELARSIEARIAAYGRAVREGAPGDEEDGPASKNPRHCI